MNARDRLWAKRLSADPEVTDRLIQQGMYSLLRERKHEFDRRLELVDR